MFLPHGLAAGTTAAELAATISVCERVPSTTAFPDGFCNPIAFNLTLAGKAVARLSVPSAQPAMAYRYWGRARMDMELLELGAFGYGIDRSDGGRQFNFHVS